MAVATVSDVENAIGRPITDEWETQRVNYWLDATELLITARLGDISALDQSKVKYVETEAVVARLSNPEGFQSESIDDYTYQLPSETRRITILPEWWDLLRPASDAEAFSTRPGFEPDSCAPSTTYP
jgi:hypothetical protein